MKPNMKLRSFALAVSALILSAIQPADAKIRLPQILSDNMVLQQQSDVNLWGWGEGRVKVAVSWSKSVYTAECGSDGAWKLSVPTPAAGYEPQTFTIADKDGKFTLGNSLIGEVGLC